ncbi:hypothetical protein [Nocardia sp. NPDC052112]|uniref:hypothetical protein n=1 Tax=Nocardia sp. NPDC052112 TaxID=3155646 RepID=UPI00341AD3B9
MTGPSRPWESLPPLKTRLLEQVQDLSYHHQRVLHHGYPDYNLTPGSDDTRVHVWQAHLRELDAERDQAVIRARANAIPEPMIEQARALGDRGIRWNARQPPPPVPARGTDVAREAMLDSVADDVWALEHTAAILAAHRQRRITAGIVSESEPVAASQMHANMSALWVRAADTAVAADLTDTECAQLWGRDAQAWRTLVEATVNRYSDTELEQHWRTRAWPGIEYDARTHMHPLDSGAGRAVIPGELPPAPQLMIDHAQQALAITSGDDTHTEGQVSEKAIAAARLDELTRSWGAEPLGEPGTTISGSTHDLDRDL